MVCWHAFELYKNLLFKAVLCAASAHKCTCLQQRSKKYSWLCWHRALVLEPCRTSCPSDKRNAVLNLLDDQLTFPSTPGNKTIQNKPFNILPNRIGMRPIVFNHTIYSNQRCLFEYQLSLLKWCRSNAWSVFHCPIKEYKYRSKILDYSSRNVAKNRLACIQKYFCIICMAHGLHETKFRTSPTHFLKGLELPNVTLK